MYGSVKIIVRVCEWLDQGMFNAASHNLQQVYWNLGS
jgi:hypothetical protein